MSELNRTETRSLPKLLSIYCYYIKYQLNNLNIFDFYLSEWKETLGEVTLSMSWVMGMQLFGADHMLASQKKN